MAVIIIVEWNLGGVVVVLIVKDWGMNFVGMVLLKVESNVMMGSRLKVEMGVQLLVGFSLDGFVLVWGIIQG